MDFSNAQLPQLLPLEGSFSRNEIEADLKRLFIDLFRAKLADGTFDANVIGAAHLGSFDLVRKSINADGLTLIQGSLEYPATRYLYRAWKSGNTQGRGFHFLRTYLQMSFPGIGEVRQLWQGKNSAYPSELYESEVPNSFLTSRVMITINGMPDADSNNRVMRSVNQIVPARFVPKIRYVSTSSVGKICIASVASMLQTFKSSGTLN